MVTATVKNPVYMGTSEDIEALVRNAKLIKEPWQYSYKEFWSALGLTRWHSVEGLEKYHLEQVRKALRDGKKVPAKAVESHTELAEDIDITHDLDRVGNPRSGIDLKDLENRPALMYGQKKAGVFVDGFLLVMSPKCVEEVTEKYIEEKARKDIEKGVRLGGNRDDVEKGVRQAIEDNRTRQFPSYTQLIPKKENWGRELKLIGAQTGGGTERQAYLWNEENTVAGHGVVGVNKNRLAFMHKWLPDTKMRQYVSDDGKPSTSSPVIFEKDGEVKGLLMPMFVQPKGKIEEYVNARLSGERPPEEKPKPPEAPPERPKRKPPIARKPKKDVGNIITDSPFAYYRPLLQRISDGDVVEAKIKAGEFSPLAKNMWVKYREHPNVKSLNMADVVVKTPTGYVYYSVPVDKKHHIIPLDVAVFRLMDIADGDRQGSERNIFIDIGIDAKEIHKPEEIGKSYLWYLYPNEGDIYKVDDSNSRIIEVLDHREKPTGRRHMIIMGGTAEEREAVTQHIKNNFTVRERNILAGTMVEIKHIGGGVAGQFYFHRSHEGTPPMAHIELDPKYIVGHTDVVVHEAIHNLRHLDPTREGVMRHPPTYVGTDKDIEESMTEAESVIRQKPFTKDKRLTGYYGEIPSKRGKDKAELVREDRVTGTDAQGLPEPLEHPKKGKRGIKKVLKNFPTMNISKMKMAGRVEAIDTFFRLSGQKGEDVKVQAYAPEAHTDAAVVAEVKKLAPEVIQYKDGKPYRIKSHTHVSAPARRRAQRQRKGVMGEDGRIQGQRPRMILK